jgi:hypothetical protein
MSLFLVRFKQTSPPIYQVKVNFGVELFKSFLTSVTTIEEQISLLFDAIRVFDDIASIDFAHSFALSRPLQNSATIDTDTTLATNLGKSDVARIQEQILNFVLLKAITESFAVLSDTQKNLGKVIPTDLVGVLDIATFSQSKSISLDTEILVDLIKFVEKRTFDVSEAESFVSKIFGKVLDNTLNALEKETLDFTKALTNISIAADIIQSVDLDKVLEDQSLVEFFRSISLGKPLENTSQIATTVAKTFIKRLVDEETTFEDTRIASGTLSVFVKVLSNPVIILEQFTRIFEAIRVFDNIAETSDTEFFLSVGKLLANSVELDSNTTLDIDKQLINQGVIDFLFAAATSKPFQNDIASSFMININTNKKFSENPTVSSTGLIRNQGYALEDYFLEGYVGQELTF